MFVLFLFYACIQAYTDFPMRATGERKAQGIKMYRHLIASYFLFELFCVVDCIGTTRVVSVTKNSSKLAILVPHACFRDIFVMGPQLHVLELAGQLIDQCNNTCLWNNCLA